MTCLVNVFNVILTAPHNNGESTCRDIIMQKQYTPLRKNNIYTDMYLHIFKINHFYGNLTLKLSVPAAASMHKVMCIVPKSLQESEHMLTRGLQALPTLYIHLRRSLVQSCLISRICRHAPAGLPPLLQIVYSGALRC